MTLPPTRQGDGSADGTGATTSSGGDEASTTAGSLARTRWNLVGPVQPGDTVEQGVNQVSEPTAPSVKAAGSNVPASGRSERTSTSSVAGVPSSRRPIASTRYLKYPFASRDRKSTRLNSSHVKISYA